MGRTVKTYAVTERFVLHAGYACNARCSFCYYLPEIESGEARDFTTGELLRRIDLAARYGKRAVDISGGEPTIRPDLPRLLERCRRHGFHTVNVITNGMRTADRRYAASLRDAGLTEGLFSLHGATPDAHDGVTKRPGSFMKLSASMSNFSDLGLGVRVNTVVTAKSAGGLDALFAHVAPFRPAAMNLLVFNPAESAAELPAESPVRAADLGSIGAAISDALDTWKVRFPVVNVRFLPFCLLPRHAECVKTQWQKAHEDQEWDPVLNVLFQKGKRAALGAILAGAVARWRTPRYRAANLATRLARSLSAFRMKLFYVQGRACRRCSLRRICPGVARDHVDRFGFPNVEPVRLAETISDPLHFLGGQERIFKSLRSA